MSDTEKGDRALDGPELCLLLHTVDTSLVTRLLQFPSLNFLVDLVLLRIDGGRGRFPDK